MKAKKKPLDVKTPADLGVDIAPRLKVLKTQSRRRARRRQSADCRLNWSNKLKNERE